MITGDHTSRKFLNGRPMLYERMALPFVRYDPEVLKEISVPNDLVGSHHDIMPTVYELLAPQGFEYHALECDLLDPQRPQIGFGRDQIIGRDFIASREADGDLEPLPDSHLPDASPDLPYWRAQYQAMLGVTWWRICKDPEFPSVNPNSADDRPVSDLARLPQTATSVR